MPEATANSDPSTWDTALDYPKEMVVVPGASHVVMVLHPDAVAKVIQDAARAD